MLRFRFFALLATVVVVGSPCAAPSDEVAQQGIAAEGNRFNAISN